jgi:hypothetical protein
MTKGVLQPSDFGDFWYDFGRTYSIFFQRPFELVVPGVGREVVGAGPGGFASSLFARGFNCIACGRCCYGSERTWSWLPGSTPPEDTIEVEITLDGHPLPLRVHVNQGDSHTDGCDYLRKTQPGEIQLSLDGVTPSLGYCSIWADGKDLPDHCRQLPDMAVYSPRSKRGRIPLLSRRLPPRNWQNPKCPVPINTIPLDQPTIEKDRAVWSRWVNGLRGVPGCFVEYAYELWEQTIDQTLQGFPPTGNLYFSDILGEKALGVKV